MPYPPIFYRLSRLLGLSLRALDEWCWDDIFDEFEVTMHVHDLDEAAARARVPG